MNHGGIKEEVNKLLDSLVSSDDSVVMPSASPHYIRELIAIFNLNRGGKDVVRLFKTKQGYVARICKRPQSTKSASLELSKLKKVGDSCVLTGNIKSLRSCVCRYQKESNLFFSNKVIDGKLHVIVIKEK